MTRIDIELPEDLASQAREAGLLSSEAIRELLKNALRLRAAGKLATIADQVEAAGIPPMSLDEIQAEVNAAKNPRA